MDLGERANVMDQETIRNVKDKFPEGYTRVSILAVISAVLVIVLTMNPFVIKGVGEQGVIPAYGLSDKPSFTFEQQLLTHINKYRIKNGLHRLYFDETLNNLAKGHSRDMYDKEDLNHDKFHERFRQCGRLFCVENVGWNYLTPEAQFKAWKDSKDHNANMLKKKVKYCGISRIGTYVTFFACN